MTSRDIRVARRPHAAALPGPATIAALFLSLASAAPSGAQSPTEIHDAALLGGVTCSISITTGDLVLCAGSGGSAEAALSCDPGFAAVVTPEWFVDGASIGRGMTIDIPGLTAGAHTLSASCGSCADTVAVTVLPEGDCAVQPQLAALYADDATENTSGVFQPANRVAVNGVTFGELRYLLRPVTVDAALTTRGAPGEVVLSAGGSLLELFLEDGTPVSLPDTMEAGALPATFLVNATGTGNERLVATSSAGALADTILFRSGPFPGLAGDRLPGYPHFQFLRAVYQADTLRTALDPTRHADRVGRGYRVYVVAARSAAGWAADNTLSDVSGGFETAGVTAGSIAGNVTDAWVTGLDAGALSRDYDVVFDFGLDGHLDPGDLVDGGPSAALLGSGPVDPASAHQGVAVVNDLTAGGPHTVVETIYSGGTWLGQDLYYPADVTSMGQLPFVVVSHGNGHDYRWYDYIGYHLASHGYIVMSHQNNTGPGIETAATTTITNTDYFLGNLDTIADGVLQGHVNGHDIVWIGHSRGGEGVTRAYDRLVDGITVPAHFSAADVIAISSIAPTTFFTTDDCNPHDCPYHLLWGSADGDVSGLGSRPWRISDHADGTVQTTYVHGACHNDFNLCGSGLADCSGPELIGCAAAQTLAKGYFLALVELYAQGNTPMKDFMARTYDDIRPAGIAGNVVAALEFWDDPALGAEVIDDFQANPAPDVSSSGGPVAYTVSNIVEGELSDSSTWSATHPMGRMLKSSGSPPDDSDGGMWDWTVGEERYLDYQVIPSLRDMSDNVFLSFRACQQSTHPETAALAGPLDFTVTLRDGTGTTSAINTGNYGGITFPYQRSGGWWNEFVTIRIRLADFENDGSGIDLTDIRSVRLDFGGSYGSVRGRIGFDRLELTRD